jgi:hypothetical protein
MASKEIQTLPFQASNTTESNIEQFITIITNSTTGPSSALAIYTFPAL